MTTVLSSLIVPSASHHHSLAAVCSLTLHRALCIRTLSSFAFPPALQTTQCWARAAVSATLSESKQMYRHLLEIKSNDTLLKGRHAVEVISDCVECFADANSQLHQSLAVLRRRLKMGGRFAGQVGDMETWVSAALTNQDTCRDGLGEWRGPPEAEVLGERVLNATYFTSNALALINKLAAEGGSG